MSKKDKSKDSNKVFTKKFYEKELERLQSELVKLQYWIKDQGLKLLILYEGRDAAGKGGLISRITAPMNPRGVRLVALPTPTEREKTQWYFQRYVTHLPAAGEIVIFDRSWYNRAGVERVFSFCTDQEYWEFLRSCPQFEQMLTRSGIILLKYWISISDAEQEKRFQDRAVDPLKRWKLGSIDVESRSRWVEYSKAKDIMMEHTDTPENPWYEIEGDNKKRARLNGIRHLLNQVSYKDAIPPKADLPPRPPADKNYVRPPRPQDNLVPDYYAEYKEEE